jgi:hypothetical protein
LASLALLLAAAATASAESAGTSAVTGPFLGTTRQQHWALRTARLFNERDAPMRIRVACPAMDPQLGRMQYGCVLDVPAGAERTAYFAFRPGKGLSDGATPSDPKRFTADAPVTAWNAETGERLNTDPGKKAMLSVNAVGLAMITGEPVKHDTDSYLHKELKHSALSDSRMLTDAARRSPDRWYGYAGADVVVCRGMTAADMTPAQVDALLDWTRRGGTAVACGCPQLADLLATSFGGAAGVTAIGLDYPDRLAVAGPKIKPVTVKLAWPYPRAQLTTEGAEVIYTADGLPLLTHRRLGAGHLFVLATVPGALRDERLHPVWGHIGESLREAPGIDPALFGQAAVETLRQIEGRPAPARTVPFLLLVALAAAAIIIGGVLRLRRRGELLWLGLVPLATAAGIAMYVVGRSGDEPERLTHIGLISDVGDGRVHAQAAWSYFSGPTSGRMDFDAGMPLGVARRIAAPGGVDMEVRDVRTTADGVVLAERLVRPAATSGLTVDGMRALAPVSVSVTFDAEGARATIENHLPAPIEQGVIYINGRSFGAGDIGEGSTQTFLIDEADRLGKGEFTSGVVPNQRRNRLIARLIPAASPALTVRDEPRFIGYTPMAPTDTLAHRDLGRQGWSVVMTNINWRAPQAGQAVAVPTGFVDVEVHRLSATVYNTITNEFIESRRDQAIGITVRPPGGLFHTTDATVRLTVDLRANGYALKVAGATDIRDNKAVGQTPVETIRNPLRRVVVEIHDADRFRDTDGNYNVVLSVEAIDRSLPMTERPAWQIQDIHAALKGTTEQ